jgi:hypothetical protein
MIPKNVLVEYLLYFGEFVLEIKELPFDDGGDPENPNNETNRSSN